MKGHLAVEIKSDEFSSLVMYIGADEEVRISAEEVYRVAGITPEDIRDEYGQNDYDPEFFALDLIRLTKQTDRPAGQELWLDAWSPWVWNSRGEILLDKEAMGYMIVILGAYSKITPGIYSRLAAFYSWVWREAHDKHCSLFVQFHVQEWLKGVKKIPRWVYFFRDSRNRIKIGISANVNDRMKGIQSGLGEGLVLLGVLPDASEELEKEMHAKFAHLRLGGEWFEPGEDLLAYIAENAQQLDPPQPKRNRKKTASE